MNFLSFPFTVVTNKIPFFLRQKNHKVSSILTWLYKAPTALWGVSFYPAARLNRESGTCAKVVSQVIAKEREWFSIIILTFHLFIFLHLVNAWKIFDFVLGKKMGHILPSWRPHRSVWIWHSPPHCALKTRAVFKCASRDLNSLKAWCTPLWRQHF